MMMLRAAALFVFTLTASLLTLPEVSSAQSPPAAPPAKELIATEIAAVIKGGTKIVLARDGFEGTEAAIGMPDGSLLFGEYTANRIVKIDLDDHISTFQENANGTIGLAYDHTGRLIATQMGTPSTDPLIAVVSPSKSVLADRFNGQPFVRPNDLVIDKRGGIYFTETVPGRGAFRPIPDGANHFCFTSNPAVSLSSPATI